MNTFSSRLGLKRFAAVVAAISLLATSAAAQAEEPHWDYANHGGAGHWAELLNPVTAALAYPDCAFAEQSPIDIPALAASGRAELVPAYQSSRLAVLNNGHTVQVNYERGSSLTVDGKLYTLLQFHFHAPSEHAIGGRTAELEVHLVHRAADGEYAVLGVMMVAGRHSAAFQDILDAVPEHHSVTGTNLGTDATAFLPPALTHYEYQGSFTTPPCTEGVRWLVLATPIEVSAEQVAAFRALDILSHDGEFVGNARPVQPLNSRLEGRPSVSPPSTGSAGLAGR